MRIRKLVSLLRDKSGVTLMELIISMTILAVFMAAASGLLVPILNTYIATKEHTNATVLANNISEVISNDLSFASTVTVSGGNTAEIVKHSGDRVVWSANADGQIVYKDKGKDVAALDKAYYFGNKVALEFVEVDANNVCNFIIKVSGKANIEKEVSVKLMEK